MSANPIKVSQLNAYIKRVLNSDPILAHVSVIGEISNYKLHTNTHVYFTLKDDNAAVNCFLPRQVFEKLRFEVGNGLEVIATGNINVYEKGGTYSLNIRELNVKGEGNLSQAFELLKKKLHTEGLFDEKYKKPLPSFPKQIALITSPTGAVVEDMKKIICSRNNFVDILIYPVLVQGTGAAEQIKGGIEYINSVYPDTDIIIIGRGGGSAEDLWAFNEEVLARAVFASVIPLISAVGHESDVTISDYVADVRAETPTAAAALAVPDVDEIQGWLDETFTRLRRNMDCLIEINRRKLADKNINMLTQAVLQKIAYLDSMTDKIYAECGNVLRYNISQLSHRVDNAERVLTAMDPHSIMKRGYAALSKDDGTPVNSVDMIAEGDLLRAVLYDGETKLEVK